MADLFVIRPDSAAIAVQLTAAGVGVCEHGINPCIARCGVRGNGGQQYEWRVRGIDHEGEERINWSRWQDGCSWSIIPPLQRLSWLEAIMAYL